MIQETSRKSYQEEKEKGLSERQKIVYRAFEMNGLMTDRELQDFLGCADANMVRPRRNELVKAGLLGYYFKRKCTITGKTSIVWGIRYQEAQQGEML